MVSAAAGAPGTDAAADALAAVGVNCSSSSSSELSACWLGCSASVWAPTAWLTARRNCSVSYAPLSNRNTHTLHCCSKSLKQYPYNFECGVRYVFGFVREIITCRAHSFAFTWSYAVYTFALVLLRHFSVLQIPVLQIQLSHFWLRLFVSSGSAPDSTERTYNAPGFLAVFTGPVSNF